MPLMIHSGKGAPDLGMPGIREYLNSRVEHVPGCKPPLVSSGEWNCDCPMVAVSTNDRLVDAYRDLIAEQNRQRLRDTLVKMNSEMLGIKP